MYTNMVPKHWRNLNHYPRIRFFCFLNQSNTPLLNNSYILILVVLHPYTISNVNDVTTAVCDGRDGDDGVNRLVPGLARVQVDHHRRPLCRFIPAWSSHVHACELLYFLEIFAVLNTLIDYFGYFKLFLYAPQRRRPYYWNTHGGVHRDFLSLALKVLVRSSWNMWEMFISHQTRPSLITSQIVQTNEML